MNVLITGTSRGIGLHLTKQALQAGHTVLAVARDTTARELAGLKAEYSGQLNLIQADVRTAESLKTVETAVAKLGSLDVLINNAGVMKRDETFESFADSFLTNATVPFMMTRAMLPFLTKSKAPKVAQISTLMGSISDNSSGGYYEYRSSKTALNMITRSLSIDHPAVAFAVIHPGWVKTDMGGVEAPVEPEDSAKGIWEQIGKMSSRKSGAFFDFRGKELAW